MKKHLLFLLCLLAAFAPTTARAAGEMSAVWPFSSGTDGQLPTLNDPALFALHSVTTGSNLTYVNARTDFGVAFTQLQPKQQNATPGESDKIVFSITPQKGVTFIPDRVYLDALRYGTDGGLLDIYLQTGDTNVKLAAGESPNRNNAADRSQLSYNVDGVSATEEIALVIYIYNLGNTKQVGLANITISGTYEGEPEEVQTYTLTTKTAPEGAGTVKQSPVGTVFNEGTEISLTAESNFGYRFINWTDAAGKVVSGDATIRYAMQGDAELTANYEKIATYALNITVDGAPDYMVSFSDAGTIVDGKRMYEEGTELQLTAASGAVHTFTHWSDASTSSTYTLTMTADRDLTASYSHISFICGWDFYNAGAGNRTGDLYDESTNAGMLVLRKADGTTNTWLDRSALSSNPTYEGRYGVVNWKPLADRYYYEASFSTKGYYNIHVQSAMLLSFNGYSTQRLQYSVDGTNYVDFGEINIVNTKIWYENDSYLPAEAENQDKVYVRWIPDYDSPLVGATTTSDGTAITDIYILADREFEEDLVPPVLQSTIPADGAGNISASGAIILNFDEIVLAGSGDCTLNGEPLTDATFSGTTVLYRYHNLEYDKTYTATIPAGAIVDRSGNAFAGTTVTFTTMSRRRPEARLYDAVVAQDGSGDYATLIEAIEAAPTGRTSPWLIFVKEGYYKGHIEIPASKPYIYLIGEDKEKVTVTDDLLCGGDNALHVSKGATVVCLAADFYAENISFENEYGVLKNDGPQALAMYTNNDRACFYNCKLRSYQDTYLTSTRAVDDRHYLKDCFIEGAVDFIYGSGDVYFDACTINIVRTSGGYIVAPSHAATTKWGYVFDHNVITAPTVPPTATSVYLGRPWHNSPRTVFLYTTSEITIPACGWYETMGAIPAVFADYKTTDAKGNLLDLSNRIDTYYYTENGEKIYGKAKSALTDEEAATYTYANVLNGSDYWNPRELMESASQPQNLVCEAGTLTWDAADYAMCYVVLRNGKAEGFTTAASYRPAAAVAGDTYQVRAANEYGSLSEPSAPAGYVSAVGEVRASSFDIARTGEGIEITGLASGARVDVYSAGGTFIGSAVAANSTVAIALPARGVYMVRVDGTVKKVLF